MKNYTSLDSLPPLEWNVLYFKFLIFPFLMASLGHQTVTVVTSQSGLLLHTLREAVKVEKLKMNGNFHSYYISISILFYFLLWWLSSGWYGRGRQPGPSCCRCERRTGSSSYTVLTTSATATPRHVMITTCFIYCRRWSLPTNRKGQKFL